MSVKIGINGFGRVGRYLTRLMANEKNVELAAINARGSSNHDLAYLLKYDSVHRTYQGEISHDEDGIIVDGKKIAVTRCGTGEWKWGDLGVDIVVDTTGAFRDQAGLSKHIECGAKKAIVSAPGKDLELTVVMGVNHNDYDPQKHHIVSSASCTTNCIAPAAMALHNCIGITHGIITTIHAYTMSQRLLDGTHKEIRRGRAAALSMLPSSTGAAKAVALVLPELKGKLDSMAIRVPTPNVSLVDLTCVLSRDTNVAEINACLKEATETYLKDYLGYTDEPLVSCDFNGSTYGGVVDSLCTRIIDDRLAKIIIWYDNEAGFTNQLLRLIRHMAARM